MSPCNLFIEAQKSFQKQKLRKNRKLKQMQEAPEARDDQYREEYAVVCVRKVLLFRFSRTIYRMSSSSWVLVLRQQRLKPTKQEAASSGGMTKCRLIRKKKRKSSPLVC